MVRNSDVFHALVVKRYLKALAQMHLDFHVSLRPANSQAVGPVLPGFFFTNPQRVEPEPQQQSRRAWF